MNLDPVLADKQRQLISQRSEEAARARQKICKQFPKTDMLGAVDHPKAGKPAAIHSTQPKTKEKLLERTGPSHASPTKYKFATHDMLAGKVSLPIGVYAGQYVLRVNSGKSAQSVPIPHGEGASSINFTS